MVFDRQSRLNFPISKPLKGRLKSKRGATHSRDASLLWRPAALPRQPPPDHFDKIPIEINQRIAYFIDDDKSLCNFASSCRAARSAIYADNLSFWRRRFLLTFEPKCSNAQSNLAYQEEYQRRMKALQHVKFVLGQTTEEIAVLGILRDVLVDALTPTSTTTRPERSEPLNIEYLRRFVEKTNLLQIVCRPDDSTATRRALTTETEFKVHSLLQTVQMLLAPELLSLNPRLLHCSHNLLSSQRVTFGTALRYPIFNSRGKLNIEYVLHNLNFWKFHITRSDESTLWPAFSALALNERPQFWSLPLDDKAAQFGRRWKGTYSFIDNHPDLQILRSGGAEGVVQEVFPGEGSEDAFQYLQLEFAEPDEHTWPALFEAHIPVFTAKKPSGVRTRAQERSTRGEEMGEPIHIRIVGEGVDQQEHFLASGFLMAMPPQNGIPGFSRIVLMKYWEEEGVIDEESLWAYEGVVLPGGQIMLGRWWNPNEGGVGHEMYSGPFILWCMDASKVGDA